MSDEYDSVAPPNSKRMKTDETVEQKKVLYIVLEGCSLETAKVSFLFNFKNNMKISVRKGLRHLEQ